MMFKHILCPVDFSEASRNAVQHATALAEAQRASLTALHVAPPLFASPDLPPLDGDTPDEEIQRFGAETAALFADAMTRGIHVDVLVERGQPARQILTRAAALPADVIVMGTHGAGGFEHLVLGSVAERVLRHAPCPVITVPPRAHVAGAPFRKMLCAVDFSEWSLAALDEACALAAESGGSVTAVHVIEWPWNEPPSPDLHGVPVEQAAALSEYRRYLETTARSRLDATVRDVAHDRCVVETKILHGKPYAQLLGAVESERADLIVIGVHGRNPLDVFFFGSTAYHVVRSAPCPVLTLRR
jgi:nucleotide-binding universal stress UspA family protein